MIDPARIGVMGNSYGGYITSWLITQDQRFAAAVPMSPVTNADRVKTPTLDVCGALDKITPASQALEFHKALQGSTDVETVLLTYPHEGHGIRNMPAIFDFTARVMYWFESHIPLRPVHRVDPDHL